ncbi:unnamed protein product [Allacma fusca]|uniref:Gustatory receptor n=1 Tax=Allacma fusca TaxID=39272 RepID=A0A8J2NWZ7_9HEXA|nr:unnamed protein product [Allacma fusca]
MSPTKQKYDIAKEFWSILFLLKCLGNCPLVKRRIETKSNNKSSPGDPEILPVSTSAIIYQFYPKISLDVIFQVILNSIYTSATILFMVNVVFRTPFIAPSLQDFKNFPSFIRPQNDSECINGYNSSQIELLEIIFGRAGAFLYQIVTIVEIVFSWWTAKDFARFIKKDITGVVERDVGKVQAETIKAWGDLLEDFRSQSALLQKTQSTMQLILLAFFTISSTIFIFVAVNISAIENDDGKIYFLCLAVGFPIISIARLYGKIISAEKVTMEISGILNRIRHSPIKISFGNYVTLNKRLLLKVIGQILTYLIVLMQVQSSFSGRCKYSL